MRTDQLKIALIQKILECEDTELLTEIKAILAPLGDSDADTTIEFIPDNETEDSEDFPDEDPDKTN